MPDKLIEIKKVSLYIRLKHMSLKQRILNFLQCKDIKCFLGYIPIKDFISEVNFYQSDRTGYEINYIGVKKCK